MMRKMKEMMGLSQPGNGKEAKDTALIASNPSGYKSDAADTAPDAQDERPKDFIHGMIWDLAKKYGIPVAEVAKRRIEQFAKPYGDAHPVPSVGEGVLETCKSIMSDRRRAEGGEFHVAFGRDGEGALSASSLWYTTAPETASDQSEVHLAADVLQMKAKLLRLDAVIHSHPHRKNHSQFSTDDIAQADTLVNENPNFKSFLLTPPPENKLLMYSPEKNIKTHAEAVRAGRIQEIGHFDASGKFIAEADQHELLLQLGFTK